jgi:type II secretory pathway pseudopilin PulG
MELLVVLLIIGILSTVALRTIDATRDRSLFDQTTVEMNKLVQAIVGNPDLAYDGRRVDFGYYGDMEQLPPGPTLRDLVYSTGNMAWRGPYVKLMTAGDTISYLHDAWGSPYDYHPNDGTVHTEGNRKFPMTVKIVDDLSQLNNNIISGSFLDSDNNPPGAAVSSYEVRLHYNNPAAHGGDSVAIVNPTPGGSYKISLTPDGGLHEVPIGIKRLQAIIPGEELTRYVTIAPRSHVVADFKFIKSFAGKLRLVVPVMPIDTSGFFIRIVSDYSDSSVTINWLQFAGTSAGLYMRDFRIESQQGQGFPRLPGQDGAGPGDTVKFLSPVTIPPNGLVELWFMDFHVNPQGTDGPANVDNRTFEFRFDDGSRITVNP